MIDAHIHHIDTDKKNFQKENLFVCENKEAHKKMLDSKHKTFRYLIKVGIVRFKEGEYYTPY